MTCEPIIPQTSVISVDLYADRDEGSFLGLMALERRSSPRSLRLINAFAILICYAVVQKCTIIMRRL
jgi:hypothetical protein